MEEMWKNWRREKQSFRREILIGIALSLRHRAGTEARNFFGKDILNHILTYNLQHIPKPTVLM